jgi:hypothetical protein
MRALALLAALALATVFIPQAAFAVEQPGGRHQLLRSHHADARASAARRHRQGATGADATFRRLRHHWGP